MINDDEIESGFLNDPASEFGVQTGMSDVETLRVTKINIIARGRRYGRLWLLKGLRKELRDSLAYRRQLQKEFEIHSRLHNPAVVQTVGFEDIPELGTCIVEEWVEGKTLADLMREGKLTKMERHRILREIIQAAGYLHSMGVVHRDLKPSNVMVRNAGKSVVLIDFGLADTDDYVELKHAAGSPGFISPEQQNENPPAVSNDIYSLGKIMKELFPEYASISAKCTGELRKRPKDTQQLQRLIDRRERLPRRIIGAIGLSMIVLIGFLTYSHIYSLSRSAHEARVSIADARNDASDARKRVELLNEKNLQQQTRMAQLTDSLNEVTDKMKTAQEELNRVAAYNLMKEQAYKAGRGRIDATLEYYDSKVFSRFSGDMKEFNDSMSALNNALKHIIETFCESKNFPDLSPTDRQRIKAEIFNYYASELTLYQVKWQKEVYPSLRQRHENRKPH